MPVMYGVYQGSSGSYPSKPRPKILKRTTMKYSLSKRTRISNQQFHRSSSLAIPIGNSTNYNGFNVNGSWSNGIYIKFRLNGFTVGNTVSTLSSSATYTDLTTLYDQYKIVKVKLTFYSNYDTVSPDGTLNSSVKRTFPVFQIVNDTVDSATPSSESELRTYSGMREFQLKENRYKWALKPKLINEVMGTSGTAAAVGQSNNQWVQSVAPDVPHYGTKLWMNNFGTLSGTLDSNLGSLLIVADYVIECKNVI